MCRDMGLIVVPCCAVSDKAASCSCVERLSIFLLSDLECANHDMAAVTACDALSMPLETAVLMPTLNVSTRFAVGIRPVCAATAILLSDQSRFSS